MDQNQFKQMAAPLGEWAAEDKEHRAVIVLALDDSESLKTCEFISGSTDTIIPALMYIKANVGESEIGGLLRKADAALAAAIIGKMMGRKEGEQ